MVNPEIKHWSPSHADLWLVCLHPIDKGQDLKWPQKSFNPIPAWGGGGNLTHLYFFYIT